MLLRVNRCTTSHSFLAISAASFSLCMSNVLQGLHGCLQSFEPNQSCSASYPPPPPGRCTRAEPTNTTEPQPQVSSGHATGPLRFCPQGPGPAGARRPMCPSPACHTVAQPPRRYRLPRSALAVSPQATTALHHAARGWHMDRAVLRHISSRTSPLATPAGRHQRQQPGARHPARSPHSGPGQQGWHRRRRTCHPGSQWEQAPMRSNPRQATPWRVMRSGVA